MYRSNLFIFPFSVLISNKVQNYCFFLNLANLFSQQPFLLPFSAFFCYRSAFFLSLSLATVQPFFSVFSHCSAFFLVPFFSHRSAFFLVPFFSHRSAFFLSLATVLKALALSSHHPLITTCVSLLTPHTVSASLFK